ncbi:hypothetical protein AVEN_144230-1 [Araneus ventricosus]|uniref:Uncharacterized protein n=1 Tax=Araneus ventricosus TaxID=182803 RepID=A0A4Y2QW17_ARAVE|nr:hypothetical protein AVEN_165853-1 [Araneus ventricosus]GBN67613.1 hypothetical protein AVEN_144230-1 [Araneus ventricosus]
MKREEKPPQETKFPILFFHYPKKKRKGESNNSNRNYGSLQHRIRPVRICILSYRHEKNPRHQTCLWRSLWKRDIPLHFGGKEKGFISFGVDRTGGSLISICTLFDNKFLD